MAERLGVAVLLVSHLNKVASGKSAYRVMGSLAFFAAARAVWTVHRDPHDRDRRLMLQSKNNLAARQNGLAYRIVDQKVQWDQEPVTQDADELLAAETEPQVRVKEIDKAVAFLREMLAEGPLPQKEVIERGGEIGLSKRTITRAKEVLNIASLKSRDPEDPQWSWVLPSSVPNPVPGRQETDGGTVGILGDLADLSDQSSEFEDDPEGPKH